jgi:hypothetical protein
VSATPEVVAMLDGISGQRGMSRTAAVRTLMREAVERGVKDERRESAYTGKKNITVNVDSEERADFKAIAKRWRLSMAGAIRWLIVDEAKRTGLA